MPYKDKEQQRAYLREWMRKRRLKWLDENGPCNQCGSGIDLEVDHIDPSTKIHHGVWSWSEARRTAELAKCQVLCAACHKQKTLKQITPPLRHGTVNGYAQKGCRCEECKAASARAKAAWRQKAGRH